MKKELEVIGYIKTPFKDKFGVPRQSGMIEEIESTIYFLPKYRNPDALRGLEEFSHIWVLWGFCENEEKEWSPTVRPPRLGGNKKVGVFATRSPNRPNPIGLSSLKLIAINKDTADFSLTVSGADMVDGTPIYDIKPYIPFSDSHPEAKFGFAEKNKDYKLDVIFPEEFRINLSKKEQENIIKILSLDPRPSYQNDSSRLYGVSLYSYNIKFQVSENILTVKDVEKM